MPGEGLRVVNGELNALNAYLGQLARTGYTVLTSNDSLPRQYLALPPQEEGVDGGSTVVFAERTGPSLYRHTITEGHVVAGAARRRQHFPWRREEIQCGAGDIKPGDRVILQDPITHERILTKKMGNRWQEKLARSVARLGFTEL